MFSTMKYHFKANKKEMAFLKFQTKISKNIYNTALYELRQRYFNKQEIPTYFDLNKIVSKNINYHVLNTYMSICTIRNAHSIFSNFLKKHTKLPKYLKNNYLLITDQIRIINKDSKQYIKLPISNLTRTGKLFKSNDQYLIHDIKEFEIDNSENIYFKIPKELYTKKIKQLRIVPKYNNDYFEVEFSYIDQDLEFPKQNELLSIDLGINNLASCVDSNNNSFVVDGKRLKSINQLYNKNKARLQSLKPNQLFYTKKEMLITKKRNLRVEDYLNKSTRLIINYCLDNNIGKIVMGYNKQMKTKISLGKKKNQNITMVPLFKFKNKIVNLSKKYNIEVELVEESFTSIASFYDNDEFNNNTTGVRIKRGLYQRGNNQIVNADINAALNILKKSKTKDEELILHLMNSGLTIPKRVQVKL